MKDPTPVRRIPWNGGHLTILAGQGFPWGAAKESRLRENCTSGLNERTEGGLYRPTSSDSTVRGGESPPHGEAPRVKPLFAGTRCGTNRVASTNEYKTAKDSLAVKAQQMVLS